MKIGDTEIILCSCGKSMGLDGKAIARACGAKGADIATGLCRSETARLAEALQGKSTTIACTQESAVFEALAEQSGVPAPRLFNIREKAGWSDEGGKATPKIAALIAEALHEWPSAHAMEMTSHGRCLIYGKGMEALEMGEALNPHLGVTVMLQSGAEDVPVSLSLTEQGQVTTGRVKSLTGSFTDFTLDIDGFAEALPNSRANWEFGDAADGVESTCDIFIDLTGDDALVSAAHRRDGYFRADPDDTAAHAAIITKAREMIGGYEKPLYVRIDESLCAHSRNGLTGCTRCLDACPASAITTDGDSVSIDPGICGGCGMCGAVCPSGAAMTSMPEAESLAARIALLLDTYGAAGGKHPALLLHDETHGNEMIAMMARFGRGLPARVIPVAMHSVGRVGHDTLVAATALGAEQVFILLNPAMRHEAAPLMEQIALARDLLAGVGGSEKDENRIILLDDPDPDKICASLYDTKPPAKTIKPAPFAPSGTPRGMTRLALRGLAKANKAGAGIIPLAKGAPYGKVEVDTQGCTVCLSCVSACPAGALQDNPDAPQLLFREDACLQCGICVATCPENVISLHGQFNLGDDAMTAQIIIEDEPFACTSCGKFFGTKKSIESVQAKLKAHSMFAGEGRLDMLTQCEDCRVKSLFDEKDSSIMDDIGERPKPRTTDDYLN